MAVTVVHGAAATVVPVSYPIASDPADRLFIFASHSYDSGGTQFLDTITGITTWTEEVNETWDSSFANCRVWWGIVPAGASGNVDISSSLGAPDAGITRYAVATGYNPDSPIARSVFDESAADANQSVDVPSQQGGNRTLAFLAHDGNSALTPGSGFSALGGTSTEGVRRFGAIVTTAGDVITPAAGSWASAGDGMIIALEVRDATNQPAAPWLLGLIDIGNFLPPIVVTLSMVEMLPFQSGETSKVSASLNPPENHAYVLFVLQETFDADTFTITPTSPGLTWSLIGSDASAGGGVPPPSQWRRSVYKGVGTPTAGPITFNGSGLAGIGVGYGFLALAGVDRTDPVVQAAFSGPTFNSTTPANLAAFADSRNRPAGAWGAVGGGGGGTIDANAVPGAGFTKLGHGASGDTFGATDMSIALEVNLDAVDTSVDATWTHGSPPTWDGVIMAVELRNGL